MKLIRYLAIVAAVTAGGVAVSASPALAQHWRNKLDRALARAAVSDTGVQRIIVRAKPGARSYVRQALEANGYVVTGEHSSIDGLAVDVPSAALLRLAGNPDINSISSDAIVTPAGVYGAWDLGQWWNRSDNVLRTTLGLDARSPTGAGVGVAIIDSGVQPTLDLAGRIAATFDVTGGSVRYSWPSDDYGHGTHVAGLIAGSGFASAFQYQGVAPGVRLTVFKVLD